jgi:hypothetical protein
MPDASGQGRAEDEVEEIVVRFIGERVEAMLGPGARFEKRPACPAGFVWRGRSFDIDECLSEWKDYGRRGKMARNMRPTHLAAAAKRGSWGVGRHYFRVRTDDGRVFDLYYDRAPRDAEDKKGSWHLLQELESGAPPARGADGRP